MVTCKFSFFFKLVGKNSFTCKFSFFFTLEGKNSFTVKKKFPSVAKMASTVYEREMREDATPGLTGFYVGLPSRSNWNLEMLVFVEGGNPENPKKHPRSSLRSKRSCAFLGKGKPRNPSFARANDGLLGFPFPKNAQERLLRRLLRASREPTKNSTHKWHRVGIEPGRDTLVGGSAFQ